VTAAKSDLKIVIKNASGTPEKDAINIVQHWRAQVLSPEVGPEEQVSAIQGKIGLKRELP
jgi:hypothetical protein